jgi:hypothetical protein
MFGRALAWIKVEPVATPVTATVALVAPPAIVTLAGTVATPGLPELRFIVTPSAGAGTERINETNFLDDAVSVNVPGKKLSVAVTRTCWLAEVKPEAAAVMVDGPKSTPVTLGADEGAVAPAGTRKFAGLTVSLAVSLLASETSRPPAGAGFAKVTGNDTVWPGLTDTLVGSKICATFTTVTVAVPGVKLEPAAEAVMIVPPALPGVTVAFTDVEPDGTVTFTGTVATLVLLLARLMTWPLAPAGADSETVS